MTHSMRFQMQFVAETATRLIRLVKETEELRNRLRYEVKSLGWFERRDQLLEAEANLENHTKYLRNLAKIHMSEPVV